MGNAPSCPQTGEEFLICATQTSSASEAYSALTQLGPPKMAQPYWDFLLNDLNGPQDPGINLVELNQFAIDVGWYASEWGNGMAWEADTNTGNFGKLQAASDTTMRVGANDMNLLLFAFYNNTQERIVNACGQDLFDDVWPEFYHMYNSTNGKAGVEAFITKVTSSGKSVPSVCQAFLQQNFTNDVQSRMGLLNMPDSDSVDYSVFSWDDVSGANSGWAGFATFGTWDVPNEFSNYFYNKTIWETPYTQNFWGNPLWTTVERQNAFRQVMGKDYQTGVDFFTQWAQAYVDQGWDVAGKTAANYWDPEQHPGTINPYNDPTYAGNLPNKVDYQVGTEPWHVITQSSNAYGYHNPCLDKPWLDSIMPYVGGIVAGGFCGIFVPGTYSRVIATATGAVVGYELVSSIFGYAATVAWFNGDMTQTDTAANVAAIGFPAALWQMLYDLNVVTTRMQTPVVHYGGMVAASALGYFILGPSLRISLDVGGGIFTFLNAPIAFLEEGLTMLFNGCVEHKDWSTLDCDCEQANTKPLLAMALVRDIYGCTDQQLSLRLEAMHAAMVSGADWGVDPVAMGECDGAGHMNNPLACISAGELAYQDFRSSFQQQGQAMWDQISYVVAADNASFLPPKSTDSMCVQKYGQFFRMDKTDGLCKDFRAPPGKQAPNQFNWDSIDAKYEVATCNIL